MRTDRHARKGFMFDVDGTLILSNRSLGVYQMLPGAAELPAASLKRADCRSSR